MQAPVLPCSVGGSLQKEAQSNDFHSLLASTSTGIASTPPHGLNAGFQACDTSPDVNCGEKNSATAADTFSCEDGLCFVTNDTSGLHTKQAPGCPFRNRMKCVKRKVAELRPLTVLLCFGLGALGLFCVYLHQRVESAFQEHQSLRESYRSLRDDFNKLHTDYHSLREDHRNLRAESDQNQTAQTSFENSLLKYYHSLRENYDSIRDDFQNLYNEFDNYRLQKKRTIQAAEEDNPVSASEDQADLSSKALLQLIRSNGLSKTTFSVPQERTRRSVDSDEEYRLYIENIVDSYLRRMPKVHLTGLNNIHDSNEYHMNRYLLWQDSSSFRHRGVTLKYAYNQHTRVKGIEIRETGIYLVYSQVIVNGSAAPGPRRDCAHQTVLLRYHDNMNHGETPYQVLLSGFVTQDSEGRYANHSVPFPRDTALHVGIFKLIRQSQVRVRIPDHDDCRLTLFSTNLHSSSFGLYRIA